jgi:hypothetical protein
MCALNRTYVGVQLAGRRAPGTGSSARGAYNTLGPRQVEQTVVSRDGLLLLATVTCCGSVPTPDDSPGAIAVSWSTDR